MVNETMGTRLCVATGMWTTMKIPQLPVDTVIDVPVVQVVRVPQVPSWRRQLLPRLHLFRNSLRAAHELMWGFFRAMCTGTGPGVVSTGTRP